MAKLNYMQMVNEKIQQTTDLSEQTRMDLIMPMVANNLDLFKKVLVEPELQKAL
jgi:hypothetical protein